MRLLYGIVSVTGLSFWFLLGFPFANHNESYIWLPQLNKLEFADVLVDRIFPVATYRPLGQAVAWLGYRLSAGSTYPVQLFNFVVALAAWLILFFSLKEKRLFSIIALVVGGLFFSGYLYLFHLHGVFYSPLLLLIALLFKTRATRDTVKTSITMFVASVVCALFHPLSLLLYGAYYTGVLAEKGKKLERGLFLSVSFSLILSVVMLRVVTPASGLSTESSSLFNFTSLRMIELHPLLSVTAFMLGMITLLSLSLPYRNRIILVVLSLFLSALLFFIDWPLLLFWVLACVVRMASLRKWSIALLIAAAFIFPLLPAAGSPTYAIFLLMICAASTTLDWSSLENKLVLINHGIPVALVSLALVLLVLCKSGMHVPVFSNFTKPILAEREKTYQLQKIIEWVLQSEQYRAYDVSFNQYAGAPSTSENAVNRTCRPPTREMYLTPYLNSLGSTTSKKGTLVVCFGGEQLPSAQKVYQLEGRYAGTATVFISQSR